MPALLGRITSALVRCDVSMPPIPEHTPWGVLSPTRGPNETHETCSPYRASLAEVVHRFGTSEKRRAILDGYLRHRNALREVGLLDAAQWVDGGFLDRKAEEPGDIDVVTLYRRPPGWTTLTSRELARTRPDLFSPRAAKETYLVEPFFIDLDQEDRRAVVRLVVYWFAFFSHQRITRAWRALVQVPLATVDLDASARDILEGRATYDAST